MANKNYPVRPDSSPKAAPVRKKDVTEVLLEVNELAEKLLEQMAVLNTKYTVLQKDGLPLRMEGRSRELFETLFPDFVIVSPKNFHRIGMLFSDDASLALLC